MRGRGSIWSRAIATVLLAPLLVSTAHADVPYKPALHLDAVKDSALRSRLEDASQLLALKGRIPTSEAALHRRAEDDLPRLNAVMEASGYWGAKLETSFDLTKQPAAATITVEPGPLFHFADIAVRTPPGLPATFLAKLTPTALGLERGAPARSDAVKTAAARIVAEFGHVGYPFAAISDQHAVVDVATDTMAVDFTVDPGATARFGKTTVTGLNRVKQDFVLRRIAWHAGKSYDSDLVEKTRQDLVGSGLFSSVQISYPTAPDAAGALPMTVALTEGPPRSVGAGVGYNTNLGAGVQAFWEHRNLFGEGEQLRVAASVAQRQLGLSGQFRRPDFLLKGQDLLAGVTVLDQKTDAYRSRAGRVFTGVEERQFPPFVFGGGVAAERVFIDQSDYNEDYTLASIPLYLRRDTTDNLLDPSRGSRQSVTLTPYRSISGPSTTFLSSRVETRFYQSLTKDKDMIFAEYAAVGSILGAGVSQVPLDKRLYAGGAGSVRGFSYQHAGPLDPYDRPTGGLSSVEFGGEFRYRFLDNFGLVPFFDAGNVYATHVPDSVKLFYSAGIGFRYYTLIGPIRLDLAVPLNPRRSDGPLQFYISIGQAF